MRLHEQKDDFADLIEITAHWIGIPAAAVKRDYFIVMMLQKLEQSEYADKCVFKGGTSLSKCYPGSIARFSEDIDLTYIPREDLGPKQYDKQLKKVENVMSSGFRLEKIPGERNDRNKSSNVWFDDSDSENGKVKLEIGSSIRPDPYAKKSLRTYIQDYLADQGMEDVIAEFELRDVTVNTLDVTRTFLDKVMAVKRHAICGDMVRKVRHIYDVTMLLKRKDIQEFLNDTATLKELLQKTKKTDSFYLEKRGLPKEYNPVAAYDFPSWSNCFNSDVRRQYERLHEDLLYTDKKKDFNEAIEAFTEISNIFSSISE